MGVSLSLPPTFIGPVSGRLESYSGMPPGLRASCNAAVPSSFVPPEESG
jgi:hypothetical protein